MHIKILINVIVSSIPNNEMSTEYIWIILLTVPVLIVKMCIGHIKWMKNGNRTYNRVG